ncbi:signal peptidase I [Streptomyces sp. NPDC006997]|uniref:signal peptidase I n=1 Tax=Streptomyces sp. NPDC006997 TaxID=3155356 RepID=UPI0033DD292F
MGEARGPLVAGWVTVLVGVVMLVGSLVFLRVGYGLVTVQGDSMAPTYEAGDRVVYERVGAGEVRRGDVVLVSAPDRYGYGGSVVRRVVAVGGDRVACCAGGAERIVVNGEPVVEPYVRAGVGDGMGRPYDVVVPEGRLFLLGDHRALARDSRAFLDDRRGTLAAEAVRGRVTGGRGAVVLLGVVALVGMVVAVVGLVVVLAGRAKRRRPAQFTELWPTYQ